MNLSVAVQHHPSRAPLLAQLIARIGACEIVDDPEPEGVPNPLRTYLECLRRTPEDATHRCVIQDDAWTVRDFRVQAEAALEERPTSLVCFYIPGSPGGGMNSLIRAAAKGEKWALIGPGAWVPVVATSWPVALIEPFLEFATERRFARLRSDDELLKRFVGRKRLEVWATVPSLVDHPDLVPSLIGDKGGKGTIRWRRAAMLAED